MSPRANGHRRLACCPSADVSTEDFEQMVLAFGLDSAVLLDSQGRALEVWPADADLIGDQLGDRYAHLATALEGRTGVSGVAPSTTTSESVIAVAVPFETSSGRRVFSGAFAFGTDSIGNSFDTVIPLTGRAYLIDDKGEIVLSGDSGTTSASTHPLTRAELLSLDQPVGSFARGGVWLTYVREPVAGTTWHVVLITASATLYQAIDGSSQVSWLLFAAFAASGLIGLVLLSRLAHARSLAAATARLDALTRLPNRRAAEEHVDHTAATAARRSRTYGVLMIDIDRFKNDQRHLRPPDRRRRPRPSRPHVAPSRPRRGPRQPLGRRGVPRGRLSSIRRQHRAPGRTVPGRRRRHEHPRQRHEIRQRHDQRRRRARHRPRTDSSASRRRFGAL